MLKDIRNAYSVARREKLSKYTAIRLSPKLARMARQNAEFIQRLISLVEFEEAAEVAHHECYECDGMGFWHILEGYDVDENELYFDEPVRPEDPQSNSAGEYFICSSCDGTGEYLAD